MKYRILFPQEPFVKGSVDSSYEGEYNVCKMLGIDTYLFDFDRFIEDGKLYTNLNLDQEYTLIYRGWMMKPDQYADFYNKIMHKTNDKVFLINTPIEYQNCHCFHIIHDDIKEFTPRIVVLDKYKTHFDYKHLLKDVDFDFFIKDHVKSIKSENGVERISKDITCIDLQKKIDYFIEERGSLFTGGIVLKEFVNLKKINGQTNEWREFYMNGKHLCIVQNSNLKTDDKPQPGLMCCVSGELSYNERSNFFTVDYAQLENGDWVVIETGDGQVSGLPNQPSTLEFYNKLIQS